MVHDGDSSSNNWGEVTCVASGDLESRLVEEQGLVWMPDEGLGGVPSQLPALLRRAHLMRQCRALHNGQNEPTLDREPTSLLTCIQLLAMAPVATFINPIGLAPLGRAVRKHMALYFIAFVALLFFFPKFTLWVVVPVLVLLVVIGVVVRLLGLFAWAKGQFSVLAGSKESAHQTKTTEKSESPVVSTPKASPSAEAVRAFNENNEYEDNEEFLARQRSMND